MKLEQREVWKHEIPMHDLFDIDFTYGAKVLCFQMQGDIPMIWVLVNPDEQAREKLHFRLAGTGHEFSPVYGKYIGTVQEHGFVWHLFQSGT